jgi:hypothetical protein
MSAVNTSEGVVKLLVSMRDQALAVGLGWLVLPSSGRGSSVEKAGGDVVPGVVTFAQGRAMGVGTQAVSRRPEVHIDLVVGRAESLGVTRRRETTHRLFP